DACGAGAGPACGRAGVTPSVRPASAVASSSSAARAAACAGAAAGPIIGQAPGGVDGATADEGEQQVASGATHHSQLSMASRPSRALCGAATRCSKPVLQAPSP